MQMLDNTSGTFTGLFIADHVIHLMGDIIGAVVTTCNQVPTSDVLGNSSWKLYWYSKEALNNAIKNVKLFDYGFGKEESYRKTLV